MDETLAYLRAESHTLRQSLQADAGKSGQERGGTDGGGGKSGRGGGKRPSRAAGKRAPALSAAAIDEEFRVALETLVDAEMVRVCCYVDAASGSRIARRFADMVKDETQRDGDTSDTAEAGSVTPHHTMFRASQHRTAARTPNQHQENNSPANDDSNCSTTCALTSHCAADSVTPHTQYQETSTPANKDDGFTTGTVTYHCSVDGSTPHTQHQETDVPAVIGSTVSALNNYSLKITYKGTIEKVVIFTYSTELVYLYNF